MMFLNPNIISETIPQGCFLAFRQPLFEDSLNLTIVLAILHVVVEELQPFLLHHAWGVKRNFFHSVDFVGEYCKGSKSLMFNKEIPEFYKKFLIGLIKVLLVPCSLDQLSPLSSSSLIFHRPSASSPFPFVFHPAFPC